MTKKTIGIASVLFFTLAGCGTQPTVGPTTVTARVRNLCAPIMDEATMKSLLITLDVDRANGASESASLADASYACFTIWPDYLALQCYNCTTAMIDHVFTH